jgi:hypothetical protein
MRRELPWNRTLPAHVECCTTVIFIEARTPSEVLTLRWAFSYWKVCG